MRKKDFDELAIISSQYRKEEEYWLKKFPGEIEESNFPYDYNKKEVKEHVQETVKFHFSGELFAVLCKISTGSSPKLHMILSAALAILLEKYTANKDIVIGIPIYKQPLEADFVNTITPIRIMLDNHMTFKELLLQMRTAIIEADENRNYPFEVLLQELNIPPLQQNLSPLFDAALLLEPIHDKEYIRHINPNMLFTFRKDEEYIEGELEYNSCLLKSTTIGQIIKHFTSVLEEVLADAGKKIAAVNIMSESERKQLLFDFNGPIVESMVDRTMHQLFEEQAEKTPDRAAAVFNSEILTFQGLNEKARQMAGFLRKKGIQSNNIVGLMMEPSIEMIVSILGILKAGGAYLPLDPEAPYQRIISTIKDSRLSVLLIKEKVLGTYTFTELQGLENAGVKVTPVRPQITELDDLPIPDRSLINYDKYKNVIGMAMVKHTVAIQASRGCPYKCAYCHKIWPKTHFRRSPVHVFEEVKLYYDMGVRRFAFIDDIFNLDEQGSREFFELIIKNKLSVQFFFPNGMRGDILKKDYIDLMVEAGLTYLVLALETASPRLQKVIQKNLNIEKLRENIDYICQKHPQVILDLFTMHGLPSETEEEAWMTMDFIKARKWLHFPYINILRIYGNTDMAELSIKNGVSPKDIAKSESLALHELPYTLGFDKHFTIQYQAELLNLILSKERLLSVLPYQMKVFTEDELVQRYNNFLPTRIESFDDFLQLADIRREELGNQAFLDEASVDISNLHEKMKKYFHRREPDTGSLRVLLLELSQFFTDKKLDMYDIAEPPLGLMYLMTYLNDKLGTKINGKIAKSRIDFDSYEELKAMLDEFKPDVIGIRTLSYFKNFFHQTAGLIRQWGFEGPLIVGGPYSTGDYRKILMDRNIDLAVIGEGEVTLLEIIEKIIAENGRLPGEDILKNIPGIAFIPGLQKNVQAFAPLIFAVDRFRREDSPGLKEKLENINKSSDLAYVLYTSGSTGAPKGVMVEHRNLNYLLNGLKEAVYKQYPGPIKICLVSPTIFDASIKQIFASLLLGHSLHIVPENMRKDIHALVNFYEKNRIDLSDGTPTHLRMMLECMETESTPPPSVSHFLIGGEPLLPKLVGRFFRHYESVLPQITNVYGPTECTVDSSSHSVARDTKDTVDSPKYIPIGKPLLNCRIYILNEVNQLQPIGIVGELCISGSGVSRGYLNRPELTFERFVVPELHELTEIKKINKSFMGGQGGLFQKSHLVLYRTGDLARWLPGGDIECLGRVDRQVKVRGYRIELGEIENRLEKIEYIKKAEVIVRESIEKGINGEQIIEKYICAYITAEKEINSSEIKSILSERLPAFMIPTYIIQLDKMPISPTGKVDRKALPEPQLKAVGNLDKPINETEKKLAEIWSEVLNINENAISMESDFFELGGHSLKALNFIAKVHKVFNVKLAMSVLFDIPTIRGIAAVIGDLIEDKFASIGKAEKKEYYPLSSAQKRLYVLQQFDRQMVHYNMPYVVLLKGPLDMMRVETAFKKLIRRHESLRTSFGMIKTELVQIIQQEITFAIQYNAVSNAEKEKALVEGFITPFDLSRAPLLRVGLISRERDVHILMLDIHHIISDAISHGILVGDFIAYYYGKQLPVLEFQYKDYAEWQQRPHMDKGINAQEKYWLNEFAGEIPALNLPNDYPRPAIKSFEGRFLDFTLNQEETRKLMQMIHTEKVTLFIILAAVYSIFLHKLSNQEDILFGTPVAGRKHVDLEKIIGVFVNTLVLRIHLPGEETFREFLTEVRDKIFKTFENQDFQFDELVEKLDLERDTSSNPLFNVMFSLQNAYEGKVNIPGGMPGDLRIEPYSSGRGTIISKFDFTLHALEKNDCLYFGIEYCVKLFKEETILRFSQYFTEILSSVINSPGKPISSIEILSLEERKQLLFDFNDTGAEYPHDKTINQLFEEQAERTPDGIAVFGCGRMRANTGNNMIISYRQLNEQSGQLALLLIEKNVRTDTIVSIIMERSLEMIIGIISILKAGGAYLPIDPTYPQERIDYMLKDSNAKILITDNEKRKIDKHQLSIVNIQLSMSEHPRRELLGLKECHGRGLQHSAFIPQHSNHLAYLIYTSGSTGKPKGVMIEHRSAVNLISSQAKYFNITRFDRILQFSSICFDASVEQIFIALSRGAGLVLINQNILLDMEKFEEYIVNQQITHIHAVPSFLNNIQVPKTFQLKRMVAGGDVCPISLAKKWLTNCNFYNEYGPTETTVTSIEILAKEIDASVSRLPIGKPISNTTVYILDKWLKPVPFKVIGEMYIGGTGTARGYLNLPVLTAEKFVQDPLSPGKKIYKTGDLCRWLANGNIEFLGRIDQQVKIRGFRIELGEIESRLLEHPSITEAVVIVREDETKDKYLCAYIVSEKEMAVSALREYLIKNLPEYMIPSHFVNLEKIPLTPNGKVDWKALPKPGVKPNESTAVPRNPIEKKLVELWAEVLGRDALHTAQLHTSIGIEDNFFELGGHSLKATILISKIHKELNVKLPLLQVFRIPTIKELAQYIQGLTSEIFEAIEVAGEQDYYPLSTTQRGIFIQQEKGKEVTAYNIPYIMNLDFYIDKERLKESFKKLIKRHDILRTSFELINNEPVQKIHKEVEFAISYFENVKEEEIRVILATFVKPFDFASPPLLRVCLIRREKDKYILLFDMHHIITDGVSYEIFNKEVVALYKGEESEPLKIQYKDYSVWQNSTKMQEAIKKQKDFWLTKFQGQIPLLNLPLDFKRPALKDFAGGQVFLTLGRELTAQLNQLSEQTDTTLYMVLLSAYFILLSRYSNQEDIVVGSPVTGRRHADLHNIIGMFVNMLTMRSRPVRSKYFRHFLQEVKEDAIESIENQDYHFEELVTALGLQGDPSRNPLFDVVFSMQNIITQSEANLDGEDSEEDYNNLEKEDNGFKFKISRFDLLLHAVEINGKIWMKFEYSTCLFKRSTIEDISKHYHEILRQITGNVSIKLDEIKLSYDLAVIKSTGIQEEGSFGF